MIELFKKQTRTTIFEFLQSLGDDSNICSARRSGISWLLKDIDIYAYSTDEEIVILMTDVNGPHTELADEEYFCDQRPLYFSEHSHRESPVWKLAVVRHLLEREYQAMNGNICRFHAMLLTTSTIINYSDMENCWNVLGVTVIDSLRCQSFPNFPVKASQSDLSLLFFREVYFDEDAVIGAENELKKLMSDAEMTARPSVSNSDDDDDFEELMRDWVSGTDSKKHCYDTSEDDDASEADDDSEVDDKDEDDETLYGLSLYDLDASQKRPEPPLKAQVLKPLRHPRKELDRLVGCTDVKRHIDELIILNSYNNLMRKLNPSAKVHTLSLHGLFFGRPGTGKTTVCKIYGSLLHEAGMLSKGHVVVCNRGSFVGSNWGDEERSVRQAVEAAKGGVLMIDEAYLLNSNHPSDPGKLVIPLLMDILADEKQRDIAVILCGYKEPMKQLIELNPGLESRFPNRFDFKDFSFDELIAISRMRLQEYGYHFSRSAMMKYSQLLAEAYASRDPETWGNARFVANLLDHIYLRHASRCISMKEPSSKHILCITPADIEPIAVALPRRRIGFGA